MSETLSTMLSLGTKAPDFELEDIISKKIISLRDFKDKKALLVMFICVHCPYVKHVQYEIALIGKEYKEKGVGIIAISSNDIVNYPDDNTSHRQAYFGLGPPLNGPQNILPKKS